MMTLDDLRRLDPKSIGSWPALPKLGILLLAFIGIIVGSYFLDWQGQLESIDASLKKEQTLRTTFIDKKKQAINLDLHRQQLREIDTQFGALLRQLPNRSDVGFNSNCSNPLPTRRCPSFTRNCRSVSRSPAATTTWAPSRATFRNCRASCF